jgi:PIN domain nuclease of toxin-antitoxin system
MRKCEVIFCRALSNELLDPDTCFVIVPLDFAVAQAIRQIPRDDVPDMPDRIIAATAHHLNLPLVTYDQKIQASVIKTIW